LRGPAKHLSKGVAIYGTGDAITSVVSFCLLAVYVKFNILTSVDYGALALVGFAETFAKIISRFGLDGAFMRFYYEREDGRPRQVMTSTIVWCLVAANAVWLTAALAASPWIAARLPIGPEYLTALRLMFVNISLIAFTFVPLHTMRMRKEAATYSAFTFARSAGQVVLRVLFVIALRLGVTGIYLTDLVLTVVLLVRMWPWLRPLLVFAFSWDELRESLRFALPRLPAGLASQALDGTPKILLGQYFSESTVGVYQNGTTLGTIVSFFKTAFETAWAPFYYETSRQPDAKTIFSKMATYGIAVLVLLVAGTTAVARDVVLLVLKPEYLRAVPVVPLIAVAMGLQGVYQLTSIGLNLTKRTEFYSAATITAAGVGLLSGLWLIPRYNVTGAAVTVLLAYSTQAVIAFGLAQRMYRVTYESGRLARVLVAGVGGTWIASLLPSDLSPLAGFLARGSLTVAAYVGLLWASGFFRPTERAFVREMIARARQRRSALPGTSAVDAR
jgi:O-antigen/teichoic acid export membrane protein